VWEELTFGFSVVLHVALTVPLSLYVHQEIKGRSGKAVRSCNTCEARTLEFLIVQAPLDRYRATACNTNDIQINQHYSPLIINSNTIPQSSTTLPKIFLTKPSNHHSTKNANYHSHSITNSSQKLSHSLNHHITKNNINHNHTPTTHQPYHQTITTKTSNTQIPHHQKPTKKTTKINHKNKPLKNNQKNKNTKNNQNTKNTKNLKHHPKHHITTPQPSLPTPPPPPLLPPPLRPPQRPRRGGALSSVPVCI
jgi:hypothetical protein